MNDERSERDWLERRCVRIWKQNSREPENFLGTGSLISARHIVTAAHVVNEFAGSALLVTGRAWASERTVRDGPFYPDRANIRDLERDIAVLELSAADQTDEDPILLADEAFLLEARDQSFGVGGFARPFGEGLKHVVMGKENYHDSTDSIVLSGALEHGMSGGPVVMNSHLVGIVYATSKEKHKTYVVPLTAIAEFLQAFVRPESPGLISTSVRRLPVGEAKKWARYVDRYDQLADLARFLSPEMLARLSDGGSADTFGSRNSGAIFAVLVGTSADRPRYLRHRFEEGESIFNPDSDYANVLTGIQVHDIPFLSEEPKSDVSEAFLRVRDRLRSSLSADSISAEDIRQALNDKHAPQAVFSTISSRTGSIGPKREQLVKDWIGFWEQVAGNSNSNSAYLNHPIVVILCVVTDSDEHEQQEVRQSLLSRLIGKGAAGRSISDWVESLSVPDGATIRYEKFAEMGFVYQTDVEGWIKVLGKNFSELSQAVDEALTDVPSVIPVEGVTMAKFVDECLTKLSIIEQGGKAQ